MENSGNEPFAIDADGSVLREVTGFFREYPFLLVDEQRLAVLLCRPLSMVSNAVKTLEATGVLRRSGEDTLICMAGQMAELKSD
jgi:hypothetical protein